MNNKAFTFIELVVAMTIVIILSGVGFISYTEYIADARDSQRKSDLEQIGSALKIYKQKRGYFPLPGKKFNIVYDTINTVAYQGFFDTNVRLSTIDKLSYDPSINMPYIYSISKNKQEYQLTATLENDGEEEAIVKGNYKSISKNILPSITLAINSPAGTDIEIKDGVGDGSTNKNKFIFSKQSFNLAYSFIDTNYQPKSEGIDISTIISYLESTGNFWQNSDYRNCLEIEESGKLIIPLDSNPFEYQILNSTGELTNTGCTL